MPICDPVSITPVQPRYLIIGSKINLFTGVCCVQAVSCLEKKWLNLQSWRAVTEIKLVTVLITKGGRGRWGGQKIGGNMRNCSKPQNHNHNRKGWKQRRYFGWSEGPVDKARAQYWSALLPLASPISLPPPLALARLCRQCNGDCFHHYGHSSGETR